MIAGRPTRSSGGKSLIDGADELPARALDADALHGLAEALAILRLLDHIGVGADHLDAMARENACARQLHGQVERRLAAQRRQQRVGPLLFDDALDHLRRERLDIGGIGQLGIGHDGGRVGVHQDHPVPLGLQCLAGLRAGVVELAGLSDHDGPGAEDEDGADVGSLGHGGRLLLTHQIRELLEQRMTVLRSRGWPRGGTARRRPADPSCAVLRGSRRTARCGSPPGPPAATPAARRSRGSGR